MFGCKWLPWVCVLYAVTCSLSVYAYVCVLLASAELSCMRKPHQIYDCCALVVRRFLILASVQ